MKISQTSYARSLLKKFRKDHIYQEIPTTEVIERQRFVVFRIFSAIAILVCISVASKMLLTLGMINWLPFTILLLGLIILLNYFSISKRENLKRSYTIMMVSCFVLLHLVSYTCGGIRTGGTFFMSAVIIYSFMLLGSRGGWIMSIACGIHIIYLFILATYTDLTSFSLFQDRIDLINEDFLVNILLTFAMISALSSYLQSGRNVVIQSLVDAKNTLETQNALLEKNNRALEKKNAELDKFASVASHDLRSPLRAIGSLTDMILEDDQSLCFDTHEKLKIIHGRVNRMDHLLTALLEFSRADRKNQEISKVDIRALILGLMVKHANGREINYELPANLPVIKTFPLKLEAVFSALIKNAIQFNHQEIPNIQIDVFSELGKLKFTVSDNGPGIHADFHEKIFVIFQTLEARDKFESTGAGLAIARKIVEENGGTIRLESNIGEGSRFIFTWNAEEMISDSSTTWLHQLSKSA